MASTDPIDEEARLRVVGGDEAAKFCVRLRDDIELQLESATAKLFNAESHIVKALYDGNNELAKREIYNAHGKSQDARCHIRRAMQLVNYVLPPEDDTLDGRWKKKFGELEAAGEVSAMEIVAYLCKCDETNPPVTGCLVHDDQGKLSPAKYHCKICQTSDGAEAVGKWEKQKGEEMEWFPRDEPDFEDYIVPPPSEGYVPCSIANWYFALPRRNWFEFPEDTIVSNPLLLEDLRFSPTIANRIARGNFELPLQAFSFPPGFTFYQKNGTVQARMRGFLFSIPAGSIFELLEEFDVWYQCLSAVIEEW
ncbi:hypothetical protein R1sor_009175 [Riccia sorocarpa]|uniref:Uncharacterized protein n=1 Tax=Riccia sorocarpa TaxID=122646 RepID=A0ABD3H6X2_9MARC